MKGRKWHRPGNIFDLMLNESVAPDGKTYNFAV